VVWRFEAEVAEPEAKGALSGGKAPRPADWRKDRRALVLKVIGGMPKGQVPGDRLAPLAAELRKNDPRVVWRATRLSLRDLDRHGSVAPRRCESGVSAWVVFGAKDDIGLTGDERSELDSCQQVTLVTTSIAVPGPVRRRSSWRPLRAGGSDEVPAADPSGRRPDAAVGGVGAPFGRREGGDLRCVQAISETPGVSPGLQLQPPETATTVRVADGRTLTTDGPFVDTKEAIGGILLFEADDVDAATELASRIPAARLGGAIEVRPIVAW